MPQNMSHEKFESLEAELYHFQQEREKVRAIVGQIGSARSSKPEHALTIVFTTYDVHEFELVLALHPSLSSIAMPRKGTNETIVKLWQTTAQQIKDDGTFERLARKWGQYSLKHDGIESEVKDGALNFWKE